MLLSINHISGYSIKIPTCKNCKEYLRPNIQLRNDLNFNEEIVNKELHNFEDFLQRTKRKNIVILEIGAGPV
jgi:NAD-dependent SIR2 family protein deacetylase